MNCASSLKRPKAAATNTATILSAIACSCQRFLPEGMSFPYDFGFIPSTLGDDGDPLDVLILMDAPVVPGCIVRARLLGAIQAKQKEKGGEVDTK